MPTTLHAPDEQTLEEVIRHRKEQGHDLHDEVWDGEDVIMDVPANPHQKLVRRLGDGLAAFVDEEGGDEVYAGVNVTDQRDRAAWKSNYRIPDVAVFLAGNPVEDRHSHYLGGPDLAVEVISRGDRTREKFGFYAAVGTRELLVVEEDYERWELYRLAGGELRLAGVITPGDGPLRTESVPLSWTLAQSDRLRLSLVGDGGERTVLVR